MWKETVTCSLAESPVGYQKIIHRMTLNSIHYFEKKLDEEDNGYRRWNDPQQIEEDGKAFLIRLDHELNTLFPFFKICIVCGDRNKDRIGLCTGCCGVYYCSRECQQSHWTQGGHKHDCRTLHAITHNDISPNSPSYYSRYNGDDVTQLDSYTTCCLHLLGSVFHPGSSPFSVFGLQRKASESVSKSIFPIPPIPALRRIVYMCLTHTITYLIAHSDNHKNNYSLYQTIADLLLRLEQDQLCYDYLVYSSSVMEQVCIDTIRHDEDDIAIQSMREHVGDCYPPVSLCYHENDIQCLAGSRYDRSMDGEYLERVYRMMFGPVGSLVGIPLLYRVSLIVIKMRLWFHWNNLHAFYTFLCCLSCVDSDIGSRMYGSRDVMSYIRSYLIDIKQCMPSSRFAVKDPKVLKLQIVKLLLGMNHADDCHEFMPTFFEKPE